MSCPWHLKCCYLPMRRDIIITNVVPRSAEKSLFSGIVTLKRTIVRTDNGQFDKTVEFSLSNNSSIFDDGKFFGEDWIRIYDRIIVALDGFRVGSVSSCVIIELRLRKATFLRFVENTKARCNVIYDPHKERAFLLSEYLREKSLTKVWKYKVKYLREKSLTKVRKYKVKYCYRT